LLRVWVQVEEARQRVKLEELLLRKVEEGAFLKNRHAVDEGGHHPYEPFTADRAEKLLRAAEAMEPLPPKGKMGHRQYRLHYQKRFRKDGDGQRKGGGWFACFSG
jgi:hypothetical protein